MESNFLSRIHFLERAANDGSHGLSEGRYSYVVTPGDDIQMRLILKKVFAQASHDTFNISLLLEKNLDGVVTRSWLTQLVLLFSHPAYLRVDGRLVISLLSGAGKNRQQLFKKQLALEMERQALDVKYLEFQNTEEVKNAPYYFFPKVPAQEIFREWYRDTLQLTGRSLFLFFDAQEITERQAIIKLVSDAQQNLLISEPVLYTSIVKQLEFSQKERAFLEQIAQLNAELHSKTEYLDFLLGKNVSGGFGNEMEMIASMKIKKFYHQEYEVLPLWYKRFGHIIKVLTGKRKLRSLFSDKTAKP